MIAMSGKGYLNQRQ